MRSVGLSAQEARARLQRFGPNEIPRRRPQPLRLFFSKLWGPIPWMLEATILLQVRERSCRRGGGRPCVAVCQRCNRLRTRASSARRDRGTALSAASQHARFQRRSLDYARCPRARPERHRARADGRRRSCRSRNPGRDGLGRRVGVDGRVAADRADRRRVAVQRIHGQTRRGCRDVFFKLLCQRRGVLIGRVSRARVTWL